MEKRYFLTQSTYLLVKTPLLFTINRCMFRP